MALGLAALGLLGLFPRVFSCAELAALYGMVLHVLRRKAEWDIRRCASACPALGAGELRLLAAFPGADRRDWGRSKGGLTLGGVARGRRAQCDGLVAAVQPFRRGSSGLCGKVGWQICLAQVFPQTNGGGLRSGMEPHPRRLGHLVRRVPSARPRFLRG